jgi:hypothetical protein
MLIDEDVDTGSQSSSHLQMAMKAGRLGAKVPSVASTAALRSLPSAGQPQRAGCPGSGDKIQAPSAPLSFQRSLWRGAQAGEKGFHCRESLASLFAAEDYFEDPAAALPCSAWAMKSGA